MFVNLFAVLQRFFLFWTFISMMAAYAPNRVQAETLTATSWDFAPSAKYQPTLTNIFQTDPYETGGAIEILTPLFQGETGILFGDIRIGNTSRANVFMNIGGGLRFFVDHNHIASAYAFFDYQNDYDNAGEYGLSIGGELLAEYYEARVNAQLPTSGTVIMPGLVRAVGIPIQIEDTQIFEVVNVYETDSIPLWSVSGEVGVKIPLPEVIDIDLRLFGGGYYRTANNAADFGGARGRVEAAADDLFGIPGLRFTLAGGISYDEERSTAGLFEARIAVPLQNWLKRPDDTRYAGLSPIEKRMTEYVRRDLTIQNDQRLRHISNQLVTPINPLTGQQFGSVVYASAAGGGDGTEGNPTDLQSAIALAGTNGIILLDGGGTATVTSSLDFLTGQVVANPASDFLVEGINGNISTFTTSAGTPVAVSSSATNQIVELSSGVTLTGIGLYSNTADEGIVGSSVSNIVLDNVQVVGGTQSAMNFTSANGSITLDNLNINDASRFNSTFGTSFTAGTFTQSAISFTNSNNAIIRSIEDPDAPVVGNVLRGATQAGISIIGGTADITIDSWDLEAFSGASSGGIDIAGSGIEGQISDIVTDNLSGTSPQLYAIRVSDHAVIDIDDVDIDAGLSVLTEVPNSGALVVTDGADVDVSNSRIRSFTNLRQSIYIASEAGDAPIFGISDTAVNARTSLDPRFSIFVEGTSSEVVRIRGLSDKMVFNDTIRANWVLFETDAGGTVDASGITVGAGTGVTLNAGVSFENAAGSINLDNITVRNEGTGNSEAGVAIKAVADNALSLSLENPDIITIGGAPEQCIYLNSSSTCDPFP